MISPHGGKLVDRILNETERKRVLDKYSDYHQLSVSREIAQEINNIATGVFSPLEGFLTKRDFDSVLGMEGLLTIRHGQFRLYSMLITIVWETLDQAII